MAAKKRRGKKPQRELAPAKSKYVRDHPRGTGWYYKPEGERSIGPFVFRGDAAYHAEANGFRLEEA